MPDSVQIEVSDMTKAMHFSTVPLAELASKGVTPLTDRLRPIVLVVDDEGVIADTLAVILGQAGFMAMVAYDGQSALELAKIVPPDLLLTDVVMPGMTGVDLAIALTRALPGCKVLLFSGQAATADLLGEAGVDFTVLAKPLHPTDLLARLSETLDLRPHSVERAPILETARTA
jgi:DNA-binding response OmpR family regulator